MSTNVKKKAVLYRMVMPDHICPYGLKSKYQLEHNGYEVEDHHLTTRAETDAFKEEYGVKTTPQTFIDGEMIGGNSDLSMFFGHHVPDEDEPSYQPVIAIFSIAFLMAIAFSRVAPGPVLSMALIERFIAISMCILGIQKLQNLKSFSSMFLGYDLLARKYVPYAYVYPFVETFAGLLMLAGLLTFIAAPAALFIGTIGAVSVFRAVYIEKRNIKCACVGGDSNVPLGFVSLTENFMMVAMAVWMLMKLAV